MAASEHRPELKAFRISPPVKQDMAAGGGSTTIAVIISLQESRDAPDKGIQPSKDTVKQFLTARGVRFRESDFYVFAALSPDVIQRSREHANGRGQDLARRNLPRAGAAIHGDREGHRLLAHVRIARQGDYVGGARHRHPLGPSAFSDEQHDRQGSQQELLELGDARGCRGPRHARRRHHRRRGAAPGSYKAATQEEDQRRRSSSTSRVRRPAWRR